MTPRVRAHGVVRSLLHCLIESAGVGLASTLVLAALVLLLS